MSSTVFVTPTVLQMEATECGAASLGMILAYHDKYVLLEELRDECGVSRDGSKASSILAAARRYGMTGKGYSKKPADVRFVKLPGIIHWNFNHFLVLEGFKKGRVYLNDPASGRRTVNEDEFSAAFTGVVLTMEPGQDFKPGGDPPSIIGAMRRRVAGMESTLLFLLVTSLALVIPGLALPTMSRVFVDDVLIQRKEDWLKPLLIGMVLTALIRAGLTWLKQRYLLRAYTKLAVASSARFLWHVLRLPISFFLARFAGEIGSRVALNDKVAMLLSRRLADSALDLIMIAFYGALLLSYDVTLTIVGVAIASINLAALRYLARKRADGSQAMQQEAGKLIGVSMGGLQIIETLKAGGGESDFFTKWGGHFAKMQNVGQELAASTMYLGTIPAFLNAVSSAAILTLGGLRVVDGTMTVGMLVAYQSLMASFLQPVNNVVDLGGTLQEAQADVKRLDDVQNHELARHIEPPAASRPEDAVKLAGYIELQQMTFGYVKNSPPLVTGLDLKLTPGKRVALVGGSGSGKSTISRVVAGLYEPWEGKIFFDGQTRAELAPGRFHHSVAMVDQDISLFEGTVRENLTLWDPSIPEWAIIQAAKDAHIHDELSTRPGGYDGKVEEMGRNFSGGQRQRLEIARALVRNPTILLLDEATSALDPKTEEIIDQNLRRRGCTCLIVAHRLSTIRDADEIIVLENGVVVERGTHTQLMEAQGPYAKLMGTA